MKHESATPTSLESLLQTMQALRNPESGCPWNRKQSLQTLQKYLLEESYEVLEHLQQLSESDSPSPQQIQEYRDELGDLLLQIVFQSEICNEKGWFTFQDVALSIQEKLVRRHPHVFQGQSAQTPEDVARLWEEVKMKEKKDKPSSPDQSTSLLSGVSTRSPSLIQGQDISSKAASVGFDWPDLEGVWDKVKEEVHELQELEETPSPDPVEIEMELGDIFFSLIQIARFHQVSAEASLLRSIQKFKKRFSKMENLAEKQSKPLTQLTLEEWESLWKEAKKLTSDHK